MQQNVNVSVEVDDIYVMAFLLAKDYPSSEAKSLGGRVSVKFTGQGVTDAVASYFNDEPVPAKRYAESYMKAKDLVFDVLNSKKRKEN